MEKEQEYKPIFKVEPNKEMPLFMFGVPIILNKSSLPAGMPPTNEPDCNLLLTITHHIKENEIELKGRMRYEATGRKTIFTFKRKKECTKENIETLKTEAREMLYNLENETPFKRTRKPFEIDFPINATIDQVLSKIKLSDEFDINKLPKKEPKK